MKVRKFFVSIIAIIGFAIISNAQVPNYVPSNGLVGWWPFNGNANDESGNGNNGTVNGATLTGDRFGNIGQAYGFDGNDVILISDNNSLDFPNGAFSISTWVKVNVLNYETSFVDHLDNGGPSIYSRYQIRVLTNNKIRFILKDMQSNFSYIDSDSLIESVNNWYHLVGTFDFSNQIIKLYVNGLNQIGQVTLGGTGASITPPGILQFGRYGDGPYANSLIDDIGIWNRALTECEIQDLYHAQLGSQAISAGLDQSICAGDNVSLNGAGGSNYQWNNNVVDGSPFAPTQSNAYVVNGTDSLGCTGSDTVVISVLENAASSLIQTALDSYTLNGQTYTQSGTYTQVIPAANGCDSTITLNLTLNFTGIHELGTATKILVKITDLNGKTIPRRKNTVMLFIFEDGTVERVVEME